MRAAVLHPMGSALAALCLVAGAGTAGAQPAAAGFDFSAPPSAQANRVFGVNRQTGEVNACQFERPEGNAVGITRCFAQGQGAGAQPAGDYALVSTRYEGETGVFRVNRATGEMSICYVREQAAANNTTNSLLVCTPPAR